MFELDLTLPLGPRALRVELRSEAPILAIVGPSGAGKSTLLRVLAGVERRAVGRVRFGGSAWQGAGVFVDPWARDVGWVPQDGVLFPHLSVRENLAYAARVEVGPIAEALGVAALLDRRPRLLSGGERQRVALGRAMARAPKLMLLDEPFAALDRTTRASVSAFVAAWQRDTHTPMVVVTHDAGDVATLGAEVWELVGERLERPG
jgi:molybdate transport system ATP-binding protein